MLASYSLLLGSTLLAFMFFILLLVSLGFMISLPILGGTIWAAVFCTFFYAYIATKFYCKEKTSTVFPKLCGVSVAMVLVLMYVSGLFYDITYDGQVYHQEAIIKLADQWNPVHEYLTKERAHSAVLLNHYAKGPWIYEAALYKVTGHIEQSKMFNFLLIIASFLLTLSALKHTGRFTDKQSIGFSGLMALNPVSIYQALSFYIDGQLASTLLCLFASAYPLVTKPDKLVLCSLVMSIALAVNIKFTGVVYVVATLGLVMGWLWVLNNKHLYNTVIKTGIIGLFVAICIIGYNPYITNTIYYGHPFYPLYGGGQTMDIMTANSPIGFMEMNPVKKLYVATFSRSSNKFDTEKPVLKIPFTVVKQEMIPFVHGADVRIGGFGPWFSGIVVLVGMIGLLLYRKKNKYHAYGAGVIASIMVTVLINPEAWWARYVPQLWLVPIVVAAVAWIDDAKGIRYLGAALASAAIINIAIISYPYLLGNYYCTQALDQELQQVTAVGRPLNVYFGVFTSNYLRFQRWGIEYVDVPSNVADINIENIRYRSLAIVSEKGLLKNIFSEEWGNKNE